MIKLLLIAFLLCLTIVSTGNAAATKVITYEGQNADSFDLNLAGTSAEVQVDYQQLKSDAPNALLNFSLDAQGNVALVASDHSREPRLVLAQKRQSVDEHAGTIKTDARFNVRFVPRELYLSVFNEPIVVTTLDRLHLVIKTGVIFNPEDIRIKIKIHKKGFLGIGNYTFEKEINYRQFSTSRLGDNSFVDINFATIGARLNASKYHFTVTVKLAPDASVVTPINGRTSQTIEFERSF